MGAYAFADSSLKKVIFKKESKLETIGKAAFYRSKNLKTVILPPSVKLIEGFAFAYSGLEKIIFEEGSELETIGRDAFYKSENLKTITIPLGVVIKKSAFEDTGCPKDIFTPGAEIVDCIVKT